MTDTLPCWVCGTGPHPGEPCPPWDPHPAPKDAVVVPDWVAGVQEGPAPTGTFIGYIERYVVLFDDTVDHPVVYCPHKHRYHWSALECAKSMARGHSA